MAGEITRLELYLTRGRAVGICFIIVEQVPSEISRAARVSAHLVVVFCTSGTELHAAAQLLGLTQQRELEILQTLGKGECIVVLSGNRCPHPLRLQLPRPAFDQRNLTRKERKFHIDRSLKDLLPDVRPRYSGYITELRDVKDRERDPNRLSRPAWRVFVRIADRPYETIEERMAALTLDRAEEISARKECQAKGYLSSAGTVGQGVRFFQLTPKGDAFAQQHNVPIRRFKSGIVHEALLRRTMQALSKACPSLRWTSPAGATGAIQPDAYGVSGTGNALCLQIHCQ